MTTKDLPARINAREPETHNAAGHFGGRNLGIPNSRSEHENAHGLAEALVFDQGILRAAHHFAVVLLPAAREGRSSTVDEDRTADARFGRRGCRVAQKHGTHRYHQAENYLGAGENLFAPLNALETTQHYVGFIICWKEALDTQFVQGNVVGSP